MKQIATILFLSITLFNLGGYRLLTHYQQSQANHELEARLNNQQYSKADLVLIKTPLHLPYYSSSVFERVSGEMLIRGVVYKYVERRVYNDTLELLCIKDAQRTGLQKAKDEFYKQSNGLVNHEKKGGPQVVKPLFFDYCNPVSRYLFAFQLSSLKHTFYYIPISGIHANRLVEQPPEV
ncbi:MAG: hypothetical protein INR73_22800 [Williamsia sp.]|nr:hypothetical protein [Williamsia sp.]